MFTNFAKNYRIKKLLKYLHLTMRHKLPEYKRVLNFIVRTVVTSRFKRLHISLLWLLIEFEDKNQTFLKTLKHKEIKLLSNKKTI